ncbi:hypothetical protein FDO65_06805 [Nakamurella flava]|uniref:Uncharacterized protein n=1 Tax=Nakamurella flava TaxID=2576308 RepID=A0A4U6QL77_9ACTN|nr:hypothetical protein [Nakamurella flava]TKV61307.1 hypothetical protein FDO65_06805 [Nakamurella flava]
MRTSRTDRTVRSPFALITAIAMGGLVLGGCATGVTGTAAVGGATTSADPTGLPSCDEVADLRDPGPAGDPVIMVSGETNAWNIGTLWTRPVALAVYDSGDAVRPVTPGDDGATIPAMERGHIDSCHLESALAELTDLTTADFGAPGVTDQGTTTVTFRPDGAAGPQQIAVYALGIGPDSLGDLTDEQLAHRERLVAALDDLQSAVVGPQPWMPDRVRMVGLDSAAGDDQPDYRWPGPDSIEQALQRTRPDCVVLEGESARTVLATMGSGASTAKWDDGIRPTSFTAAVLVLGQPGCPE